MGNGRPNLFCKVNSYAWNKIQPVGENLALFLLKHFPNQFNMLDVHQTGPWTSGENTAVDFCFSVGYCLEYFSHAGLFFRF